MLEGPSSYVINRHRWSVLYTRIEFKMLDVYLILQGESEDENKIFIPHHFRSKKRSDQKISSLHHSDPDVLSRHLFIVEQKDDSLSCEIFYGEEISLRTFFSQQ